jgi:predicted N-acetyltransferase YhbS
VGEDQSTGAGELDVVACGAERAEDVHRLTQAAFGPYGALEPPSGAVVESVERVAADLAAGGGAVAERDGIAVGCLRWRPRADGDMYVGRVAIEPGEQGSGIGRALVAWAEGEARRQGRPGVSVGVRIALPANLAYFRRLGYEVTGEHSHEGFAQPTWLSLRKEIGAEPPAA